MDDFKTSSIASCARIEMAGYGQKHQCCLTTKTGRVDVRFGLLVGNFGYYKRRLQANGLIMFTGTSYYKK